MWRQITSREKELEREIQKLKEVVRRTGNVLREISRCASSGRINTWTIVEQDYRNIHDWAAQEGEDSDYERDERDERDDRDDREEEEEDEDEEDEEEDELVDIFNLGRPRAGF